MTVKPDIADKLDRLQWEERISADDAAIIADAIDEINDLRGDLTDATERADAATLALRDVIAGLLDVRSGIRTLDEVLTSSALDAYFEPYSASYQPAACERWRTARDYVRSCSPA